MRISFSIYKHSPLATIVKILGVCFCLGAVQSAIAEREIVVGIILGVFGIGLMVLAGVISERKKYKLWLKMIKTNGLDTAIRDSVELAVQAYSAYPCNKTLAYLSRLNPTAVELIAQQRAETANSKNE